MAKRKAFYQTEQFLATKREWDAKLKESGFNDLEIGETDTIIRPQIIKTEKSQYDGGNQYYELCQSILREYRFTRPVDRKIFELHTVGKSIREIEEQLQRSNRRLKKTAINAIIMRVKESYLKGNY